MYRRNSTKLSCLDRRKSTSSAKSVHLEYIRPETAERDAQAAAMQAFKRAKERSTTEAPLWPPARNYDSNETNSYDGTPDRRSNDPVIRHQQSVRFVRERPPRSIESYPILENATLDSGKNTAKGRVALDVVEPRPMTSASAAGMASAAKGTAGDYINALFTGEEYYTPEDDFASAPSSYRKIRKSRSMFTCSEASMTSRNHVRTPTSTVSQLPPSSAASINMGTEDSIPPTRLKAPKSMSFLRGRREQPMLFSKRRGSAPIAPSINRNTGSSSNKERSMKPQPSSFLRSKSSNTDKFLRKSMRDASNDTLLINGKIPKDGSLRNRARKVSHNFKHKLKSLFSLGKGDSDEEAFPPQQIEAAKSHITDLDDHDYMKIDEFQFDSTSDEAAISRVPSGVPSLHAVPSNQQLRSRQGSVESLRSERRASDDRSRVTSWTNSDTNTINTLSSRKGEWERQRLSVIKENGMHVSSSSTRCPGIATHVTNPNNSGRSLPPAIPPQPATVNSQRIYSALMKRLSDTNKHSKGNELKRKKSVDDFITAVAVPPRGSSRDQKSRGPNSPATIRHVVSDGLSDTSSTRTIERKPVASSRKVKAESSKSPSRVEPSSTKSGFPSSISAPLDDWKMSLPRIEEPTPTPPLRTLSTRSSAFFASPTCHLFRTRSPYRRALQDSIRTESQNTHLRSPEYNPWMRSLTGLPIRCPSTCDSEMDIKMQYAESVYSSTSDLAAGPSTNTPGVVDSFPKPPTAHGDATIFVSPPVYRPTPPPPFATHRVTSSTSSVEWKTWLSANVSKLEGSPDRPAAAVLEYAVPSTRPSGHVRERAQITDDDDDDDDEEQPPLLEVYQPTRPEPDGAFAPIAPNARPPAPHDDKENEVPERTVVKAQSRNALRATPSLASMRSAETAAALAHKASPNTLATRKLVKKQPSARKFVTPTPSPGPKAAVEAAQSGKMGGGSAGERRKFALVAAKKTENVSPKEVGADPYDGLGAEKDLTPQSVGSKMMVDLFLSSRRKRMASDEEGGVFM
ncbi:hypothetical protein F4781DRAFT_439717 [Annulohypoxylon bovei var. microspora]|nr:hypothetical protein F4781DRAFT_439717 [Annulohypoxylon bovei var. microspora]